MATLNLKTSQPDPAYVYSVTLDGAVFRLQWRHNQRADAWHLDISDADGNPIRSGMRAVLDWALMREVVGEERPAGDIVVLDQASLGSEPRLADLGVGALPVYSEAP